MIHKIAPVGTKQVLSHNLDNPWRTKAMGTAAKLIKARSEYVRLATTHSGVVRAAPKQQLRFQAFVNLSDAYNEYVAIHGDPAEEE